jgi:CheY-like chemotaxis protein
VGLRIVVVDDSPEQVKLMERMLRHFGATVTGATDGAEALRMVGDGSACDVLVTDCEMSPMSGGQLAQAVRRQSPTVWIIMCSGDAESLRSATNVDVRLPKPVSLDQLRAAVEARPDR